MKKILIIWAIVALIAVGALTYMGLNIKKQNAPYNELEKKLEEQVIALIGEKPSILGQSKKITLSDLSANNYNVDMNVNGDVCDGYVIVSQSMSFYKYSAYIKCNKYTTHGYKN